MKYTIHTEIIINAPIEKVWQLFRNFETHGQWNEFIRIHGQHMAVDKQFKIDFLSNGKVKMTIKPILLKDNYESAFEWIGHLGIKGLFDAHHYFHFEKLDAHHTRFTQKEDFSGLLVRLFKNSLLESTEKQFNNMNQDFKCYVESEEDC